MSKISVEQYAVEWGRLLAQASDGALDDTQSLATEHQAALASHFYTHMLEDAAASLFLSHENVQTRLHSSMQRWVTTIFSARDNEQLQAIAAQQVHIGEVHARINLPIHLVLRGARRLKEKFSELIEGSERLSHAEVLAALRLINDVIDVAMEIMSQAYASSNERQSRSEEAYRLFSVAQHAGAERERQRAALLAWENQLMYEYAMGAEAAKLPRLSISEFGLWFRHKGAHAFQGITETDLIMDEIERIDNVLLALFALPGEEPAERASRLRQVHEASKGIAFHLDNLFEQNNELENGRDVLTRLLNRKFLPVILSKEVNLSKQGKAEFALLSIDIDHFKKVNDSYGHEAGDVVLQQLASILSNNGRGGDNIFRMGGEEFLMVLVDTSSHGAKVVAEKIRKAVESESFRLPQDHTINLTVSIGVTLHNGHPDYQPTLRLVDKALFQAKNAGRNRVVHLELSATTPA